MPPVPAKDSGPPHLLLQVQHPARGALPQIIKHRASKQCGIPVQDAPLQSTAFTASKAWLLRDMQSCPIRMHLMMRAVQGA